MSSSRDSDAEAETEVPMFGHHFWSAVVPSTPPTADVMSYSRANQIILAPSPVDGAPITVSSVIYVRGHFLPTGTPGQFQGGAAPTGPVSASDNGNVVPNAATTIIDWRAQLNSQRPQAFMAVAPGNETVFGATGAGTLFGGAGQDLTFIDGSNTTQGANIIAAGSGNETLNAAGAKSGVCMAIGSGSVDLIGSAAGDTIFGGSGAATITTNGGSDLFVFGSTAGGVGGTDLITDFNTAKDRIFLSGVTVASETAAGTSPAMITLSDGTRLTFTGIEDPARINIT